MPRTLTSTVALMLLAIANSRAEPPPTGGVDAPTRSFTEHIVRVLPMLMDSTGVPGIAVGLIVDGRVAFARGFGVVDRPRGEPITLQTTFNVGSISKCLTAWEVMRLVEAGRMDLDAPVNDYLRRWRVASDSLPAAEVTVRRLLSHTAGLSLAAVPEYGPDRAAPSLVDALSDAEHGVALVARPGSGFRYSGGGYMVLQLVIEEITGRRFADVMREDVLRPLGMGHSAFTWPESLRARAATPHHDREAAPYFQYVGEAAASLNTPLDDLLRFALASLPGPGAGTDGAGNLRPETVSRMRESQPGSAQFGGAIQNGLGFALWHLGDGSWAVGHTGQNTGWGAALWTSPGTRDGLVVLTNASNGRDAWRWILCDWVAWIADTQWRGICTDRPAWLPPPPTPRAGDPGRGKE